ncbi:ligand-dependent nuclear receptor-interacting factor 1 isoform X2 [Thalassophryne amazonica]|uniref:ligand-dependent nuclear receptor-interacting factor 1 isoform X2 n=1 Tax=Thalassophryne amazonica TaxID=390379 RepID=UPI001472182A|nr:ligand-dependent nuclear receptor-interacting factor 1 isoform X2 [Thalassophryne amazonica]
MFPATDPVHSGTGVFYQAMPAVGADGKNIMKLIPVQMVNGQFVQSQISKSSFNVSTQKAIALKIASPPVQLANKTTQKYTTPEQFVRKHVSLVSTLPHQIAVKGRNCDVNNLLNKYQQPGQMVNLMSAGDQTTTTTTNVRQPAPVPSQPSVTVRPPVPPSGQNLQILQSTQIKKVPQSELRPGVRKQIFTSRPTISVASSSSTAAYVSPLTFMNPDTMASISSAAQSHRVLTKTSGPSHSGPSYGASKPHLKLIPKVSERPDSPIKWVIEDEDNSSLAPSLDPLNSPSITSEILRTVAQRENAKNTHEIKVTQPPQAGPAGGAHGQDSALLMCNGKVFFVTKKCGLSFQKDGSTNSDSATASARVPAIDNTCVTLSKQVRVSDACQSLLAAHCPPQSDDVIDLCDDDYQDDVSKQATSALSRTDVTPVDEDNVIFVSYIPPQSVCSSAEPTTAVSEKTDEREPVRSVDSGAGPQRRRGWDTSSNAVPECFIVSDTTVRHPLMEKASVLRGDQSSERNATNTHTNTTKYRGLTILNSDKENREKSLQRISNVDNDLETMEPSGASATRESCLGIPRDRHQTKTSVWSSSPAPEPCQPTDLQPIDLQPTNLQHTDLQPTNRQPTDRQLRLMFGITADVKVCLQFIDVSVREEDPQYETKTEERVFSNQPANISELYSSREDGSSSGRVNTGGVRPETEHTWSGNLETDISPVECVRTESVLSIDAQCHSSQTSQHVEFEPAAYMEPVDEDLTITDTSGTFNHPLSPVELDGSVRRVGRARKRTMCPCCIPASNFTEKPGARTEELETSETPNKRSGRIMRAARKHRKLTARMKRFPAETSPVSEGPAANGLSAMSMDCDEVKLHEQIKRLKDLLKEKETALEKMRKSIGSPKK